MFKVKKITYPTLGLLLITTFLVWLAVFEQTQSDLLEVTFFDVGQGDAIFIKTPNGRQVLIDGGPDRTVLEKLNQVMPFYDRDIDLIILTHPETDHLTGLVEVLEYYQVGHILTSGIKKDTIVYQKWQDLVKEKNIPLTIAQAGQKVILQNEVILEILWPEQSLIKSFTKKPNNVSVVSRLAYRQAEILLTGDIEKEIERQLLNQGWHLESDILKIPHHGSKTSSSYHFINAVNPQIAVISVGANNRYGHPHAVVLERLKNSAIYRTDKNGDIRISTDGMLFKIETD
jgi:competence protein ComEC